MKQRTLALLVLLLLVGSAIRLAQLNQFAIRGDEAFTITYWMRLPLGESLRQVGTIDPQPPLAYALYRLWGLIVGTEAETVRFLPALFSIIGIAAIYSFGKRLGGITAGLIAALLWVFHPMLIWHAQDARNYAIWSTLSVCALWLAIRALERQRRVDWVLYISAACLAGYVYYLEIFGLAALSLYVLISYRQMPERLLKWFGAMLTVGSVLAPWYLQPEIRSGGGYGGTTAGFQAELLWLRFLPELNFGQTLPAEVTARLWWVLVPLLVIMMIWLARRYPRPTLLLFLLLLLPPVLLAGVSLFLNVFTPRYVMLTIPAFVGVVALGVSRLWRYEHRISQVFSVLLLVVWLGGQFYSLSNYFFSNDYAKSPDWRTVVTFLNENASPDDIMIQRAADEALNFYYDAYSLTLARKQLPANPTQSADEIVALLDADLLAHRSLWMLAQTFPDWQSAGIVEHWTAEQTQQVRRGQIDRIPIEQYMAWSVTPEEIDGESLAVHGDSVRLLDAQVFAPSAAEAHVTVWLYWQPLRQTETPLKVFVHLTSDQTNPATGSPLWSQADQFPQGGRIATDTWQIGEIYRDVYMIPAAHLPPGTYHIEVGLYEPSSGERLEVEGDTDLRIASITLP
jgi:hypothetical protein